MGAQPTCHLQGIFRWSLPLIQEPMRPALMNHGKSRAAKCSQGATLPTLFSVDQFEYIHVQESDGEATAAKISVGLGVFIYALNKLVVLFIVEMKVAAPKDKPHGNFCLRIKKAKNSRNSCLFGGFYSIGFY